MLPISDVDRHFPGDSHKSASARVRHDRDVQVKLAAAHGSRVLQDKAAASAFERSSDFLNGNVSAGAFDIRARSEHLTNTGPFDIAVVLLVESHTPELGVSGFVILRRYLYIKRACSMHGHRCLLMR